MTSIFESVFGQSHCPGCRCRDKAASPVGLYTSTTRIGEKEREPTRSDWADLDRRLSQLDRRFDRRLDLLLGHLNVHFETVPSQQAREVLVPGPAKGRAELPT